MDSLSNILSARIEDFTPTPNLPTPPSPARPLTPDITHTSLGNTPTLDINQLKLTIYHIKDQLDAMLRMLDGSDVKPANQSTTNATDFSSAEEVIEGVFNGEKMIGPDGKEYAVPPNYASKSKLVEGDLMKLTILRNGRFLYKQIGPIVRKRMRGQLVPHGDGNAWSVTADGKSYRILTASVTFYKGMAGDEVIFLVPENGNSAWGAVENIIHQI